MSVNKLVSMKNAIIDAQDFLGIDHDKDVPFFHFLPSRYQSDLWNTRYQKGFCTPSLSVGQYTDY